MRKTVITGSAALLAVAATLFAPIVIECLECDNSNRSLVTGATFVTDGTNATAYLVSQLAGGHSPAAGADPVYTVYRKDGVASAAGTYSAVGTMRAAVDPGTVKALLQRSWSLRSSSVPAATQEEELSAKLDQMFGSLAASAQGQDVSTKLANVIAAAMADEEYRADLELLGKTFPGVNLCLGSAWAGPVPTAGPSTFEVRLMDPSTGADMAVVGRVTIDPSIAPTKLPRPGAPVNAGVDVTPVTLPAISAKPTLFANYRGSSSTNDVKATAGFSQFVTQLQGQRVNRAVRLRWATPDDLRQRSVLQNGYNIYRLDGTNTPPAWVGGTNGPTFQDLINRSGVVKVNTLPVVNADDLNAVQAADTNNTATVFYTDEITNSVTLPGGYKEYAYFVTALDVLGRDGAVSPGTKVAVFNRMPPPTVRGVEVRNEYNWSAGTDGRQRFKITWDAVNAGPEAGNIRYEVYRWDTYDGARRSVGADPVATNIATTFFTDDIAGSPGESDAGKTFWYTVRSVRTVNAGTYGTQTFRSGHSAPVFGVIRDREGPQVVGGGVDVPCQRPTVTPKAAVTEKGTNTEVGARVPFTLKCTRTDPAIAWVEFSYKNGGTAPDTVLATMTYGPGNNVAEYVVTYDAATFGQSSANVANLRCRVGTANGAVSPKVAPLTAGINDNGVISGELPFEADTTIEMVPATAQCPDGGDPGPVDAGTGDVVPSSGTAEVEPLTREVKIYRRVNDGPMTFVDRIEFDEPPVALTVVTFTDRNPPPMNGGRVCYYAQAYDVDGNAGAYYRCGCREFPALKVPVPYLERITANPAAGSGQTLNVSWTCPPQGVDHFLVWISQGGHMPPSSLGVAELGDNIAPGDGQLYGPEGDKKFGLYRTSRVAGRFSGEANANTLPEPPAEFSIALPAESGSTYTVLVQAVSATSTLGGPSNVQSGSWETPVVSEEHVPWPQRDVPPKFQPEKIYLGASDAGSGLELPAVLNIAPKVLGTAETDNFDGIGVSIGRIELLSAPDKNDNGLTTLQNRRVDPNKAVFRVAREDDAKNSLFPCALYRYRVADPFGDTGIKQDLVQVTPLMESIAYGFVDAQGNVSNPNGAWTRIYDRFIRLDNTAGELTSDGKLIYKMYLTDTLPVVSGATYRYLLVRFDSVSKEPKHVIPVLNSVTVP